MIQNYIRVAIRNLKRNITFSVINIFGLTLGLAISSLILLYVINELTYDSYHKDSENIYRLFREIDYGEMGTGMGPRVNAPLGPYLVHTYPKVTNQTRVTREHNLVFSYEDKTFDEKLFYADSSFFSIFTYDFIYGNPHTALLEPFSLVLTQSMSHKFFGDMNPVGEVILGDDNERYKVTAVIENVPENSHFKFEILSSFLSLYDFDDYDQKIDGWGVEYHSYTTYIKVEENYDVDNLTAEFPKIIETYLSGNPFYKFRLSLQPIEKIHLYYKGGGDISRIILFSIIGFFILLIACINYMNLNTAISINRLKEVGMRKVLGARRKQLIRQFLFESNLLSLLSLILAITLAEILLPSFNFVLQRNLSFNYIENWPMSLGLILMTLLTGLFAGSYQAFYLSSFKPVNALKGKFIFGSGKAFFRNSMVVFQFAISIFLLCCTGVILMQLNFANNADLGFQREEVLTLRVNQASKNIVHIKNELSKLPEITKLSMASGTPFGFTTFDRFYFEGHDEKKLSELYFVDANFVDLLELTIVKGRDFSDKNSLESNNVIINETLAKELNWDEPIGKKFKSMDGMMECNVIGVVKDFHRTSFHQPIIPSFLKFTENPERLRFLVVKYQSADLQKTIQKIEKICKEIDISWDVVPEFLDQEVDKIYMDDARTGKMFFYFTILAVLIASMGLYGLALFIAKQKSKEIGIRKIFGSSVSEIIETLSKNFIKLMLISAAIAIPLAWYYTDIWLQSFVYQLENRWVVFVFATILAIVIAFTTIFYQSFRAATSNPVDTIKYE